MEKAKIINSGSFTPDNSYFAWLNDVKAKLHRSQIKASLRINQAMLEFYWEMGHDIETLQKSHSWGSGFFERLSLDLRSEFPGQEGFSVTNLRYMKNWYLFYSQCFINRYQAGNDLDKNSMPEILAHIPWRHHIDILRNCKNPQEALFYINETIKNNWSRSELNYQIDSNLYGTRGKALTNFDEKLPAIQGKLASELLKSNYQLDFLPMGSDIEERNHHQGADSRKQAHP